MKFKESKLAHRYCTGYGLEIGGSAHNPFGLNTKNVDFTKELTTFKKEEISLCGEYCPVDIEAAGDDVPLPNESQDFIISSHVLEHFTDPIKALLEWHRLVKKGGIIFMIVPHKERTFDSPRNRTTLQELIDRHAGKVKLDESTHEHYSVWITEDLVELINFMNKNSLFPDPVKFEAVQDVDDKVGNGFTVVLRKSFYERDQWGKGSSATLHHPGEDQTIEIRATLIARQLAIAFIQANNEIDVQWYRPLVFGYLKAYLDKNLSAPVRMEMIERPCSLEYYQILAISSTSQNFSNAISIARKAKHLNKNIITVLGGHHVTHLHHTMPEDFDIGVIGEGEQTFLEIIQEVQKFGGLPPPEALCSISGIVYWQNGHKVATDQRQFIEAIDSLPHPYRFPEAPQYLFTSRGCPFHCTFCSSSSFWRKARLFSAEYVVDEIEQLIKSNHVNTPIPILDDLFIIDKQRLEKIISLLETRNLIEKVSFSFSVRANLVDDRLCNIITRLKIDSVAFGAESGSDRILTLMNKQTTVQQNQKAIDLLKEYRINTICSFIVGWPTETEEDVRKTFDFISQNVMEKKLPPINAINILMPIPGTQLWEESVRNGKINPNTIEWEQLSVFADYQHSKLTNFKDWVTCRTKVNSVYLAEDTLPEERLYELMYQHYQSMAKLQELRNREIQRKQYNQNKLGKIFELITETDTALFDQEAAIDRWKFLKGKGKAANNDALTVCSGLFSTMYRLTNEMAEYGLDSINFQDGKQDMAGYCRGIEDVIKLISTRDTLDDVNQVIEEQLLPKLKVWPAISRAISHEMKQYINIA